jgi:hypothetical protein
MKFNSFQKLTLVIYVITIISLMIFMVPFKSFSDNGYSISYDFIWSNRKVIDFFRFSIFVIIPSFVFFLIIKYYQKYNVISNESYNKKLFIEKKIFIFYIFSIVSVLTFLVISNFLNNNKIIEINIKKELIEKRIFDYKLKKENRVNFYNELSLVVNLSQIEGGANGFWIIINEKLKSKTNNTIPITIRESIKTENFKFKSRKDFENFILKNNYNNFDVETENTIGILLATIDNKKEQISDINNKIYSFDDILRTLLFINLLMIFLLFVLRPTTLFVVSIFNETK